MQVKYKVPKTLEIVVGKSDKGEALTEVIETNMEGLIELDIPSYVESTKAAKDHNMKLNDKGESVEMELDEMIEKIVAGCKKHIKSIAIKTVGDFEIEITKVEELEKLYEGRELLNAIYKICLKGFRLGKPLPKI